MLHVRGADLVDGTPIFDIKPYLPYADSHPDARGGFTDPIARKLLRVSAPEELREKFPAGLLGVLENDPRPRYQDDPERVYGLSFGGWNVRFRVAGEELTVLAMERADGGKEQRCKQSRSIPTGPAAAIPARAAGARFCATARTRRKSPAATP